MTDHITKSALSERGQQKHGARVIFSQAVSRRVLRGLMAGRSVVELCQAEDMPDAATVYRWIQERADFAEAFAQAREGGLEALFDQIIALSDGVEPLSEANAPKDAETVQRAKLRIDARKWALSKLAPQRFGERIEQKSTADFDLAERLTRALKRVEQRQETKNE